MVCWAAFFGRAPDHQLFLGCGTEVGPSTTSHISRWESLVRLTNVLFEGTTAPATQRRQGVYYTPKPIAELMVRASFRALERRGMAKSAKILDPAVGGGMFLLTAFRELVAAHWRANGRRPDTNDLRQILYDQLVGFDINEVALRYAALGLYLLSIELDPNPRPVDKLKFDRLREKVLFRVKEGGVARKARNSAVSDPLLGTSMPDDTISSSGIPLGQARTGPPGWKSVLQTVARIAVDRNIANTAPPLPKQGLDLPFVWRAMEWAKPGGQIAFALHARLLFQQGTRMPRRSAGPVRGARCHVAHQRCRSQPNRVWPGVSAPFCILFATNKVPGPGTGFRFISPRLEESLNQAGAMRIDALNAEIVPTHQLGVTPEILKILFRGTKADSGSSNGFECRTIRRWMPSGGGGLVLQSEDACAGAGAVTKHLGGLVRREGTVCAAQTQATCKDCQR